MAMIPWDKKYRPRILKDFIFQDESQKALINKFIEDGSFPHLLLSGNPGVGKTSLAYLLKELFEIDKMDFLYIPASDDNNVDTVRTTIKSFVSTYPTSEFKIVLLDEADYLTPNAQGILRTVMLDYAEQARFILTCNYAHKIIPALKSRCTEIKFKAPDRDMVTVRAIRILAAEGVKIESEEDFERLDTFIEACYPDFRKLLKTLQDHVRNGKLVPMGDVGGGSTELCLSILDMIEQDDWDGARKFACSNASDDQWEEIYTFLYTYLDQVGKFKDDMGKWKQGIIVLSDHLYRHSMVADHEINFAACAIKLSLL